LTVGFVFSKAWASSGARVERSEAAATVTVVWPNARALDRKNKVNVRELDKRTLIFNNESVLRAAGSEIRRSAEAKTLT
jgi:hypothetical protein